MTKYDEALLDEAKKLNKSDFLTLAKWYISSDNGECLSVFDIDTNSTEDVIYIDCFRDDTEETELWVVALDEESVDKEIIEASNPGYSNYNSICFNDDDKCKLLHWLDWYSEHSALPKLKGVIDSLHKAVAGCDSNDSFYNVYREV